MNKKKQLTPAELELMEILWEIGQGTVRDILERLPAQRKLAYTSVSTILRILQQKNILTAKKIGRQHIYRPLLSKNVFASHSVTKMIKQVFSGNSLELVNYLLDKNKVSLDDINAIEKLLEIKKKELSNVK